MLLRLILIIMRMRIVLTGGGSGGHLFPLLAVAEKLKQKLSTDSFTEFSSQAEIYYVGPVIENQDILNEFQQNGILCRFILAGKIRRYFSWKNFIDPFKTLAGFFQTFWIMFRLMPNAVFSKGGFGAISVCLISKIFFIPLIIHESDSVPGLSNKICKFFATKIGVAFPQVLQYFPAKKTAVVGNPVREKILTGTKNDANRLFNFVIATNPVILVLGGSQGAEAINDLIFSGLPDLLTKYELIHQTGPHQFNELQQELKAEISQELGASYHMFPFLNLEQISSAYAACSVIVSRAGAGSIFEIAALRKPSIIIPLPNSASDHQRENAYAYASSGAAVVLEQQNLTYHMLIENIERIVKNPKVYQKMAEAAQQFFTPNSAEIIAAAIIDLVR
jgi:UDP-N-acetylglucosamine--N-acetylmuramyl-(pentapeptide) pyrophosphoryl-undecaprenol N-acetylglucosamine transferase